MVAPLEKENIMKADYNFIESNKSSWNQRTQEHYDSDFYDVKGFVEGKSSLNPIELGLLGNIRGKKILHLQCHFGLNSISLSRMGGEVTGIDLSDEAIRKARQLAKDSGTDTRFVCCNIFDLPDYLDETFDIVFTSYGVINWFPNLDEWGRIVSRYLKPDGKFVMVEFHPVLWMFDTKFERVESAYSREEPYISTSQTYTNASEAGKEYVEVTWNHGLSKVLQGLLHANLRIVDFQEYDYSPFNLFGNMEEDRGMYYLKDRKGMIPILFSVVAER